MVSFGQALKLCLKIKLLNFSDRAPRSEFWWFMLGGWLIGLLLTALNLIPFLGQIVYLIGNIWLLIASLSVSVRRLHDLNKSGWWIMFPYAALIAGLIVLPVGLAVVSNLLTVAGGVILGLGGISILVFWIMMIMPGTAGLNRFGPDPLAKTPALNQA